MKRPRLPGFLTPIFIFILVCGTTSPLPAETPVERELATLREERVKAAAAAIAPINRRYQKDLKALLYKAVKSNDRKTAARILAEMDMPEGSPELGGAVQFLMNSDWALLNGTDKFQFRPDGTVVQLGEGWQSTHWKLAEDGKSVQVEFEGEETQIWTIANGVLHHPTLGVFAPHARSETAK